MSNLLHTGADPNDANDIAYECIELVDMRQVTSICEDSTDGTLRVIGMTAPAIDPNAPNPDPADGVFTRPRMAEIEPNSAAWSDPNGVIEQRPALEMTVGDPNTDPSADLALPLSAVYIAEDPNAPTHTLALTVKKPDKGTITFTPDQLADPNDDPNDPNSLRLYAEGTLVTLEASPSDAVNKWTIFDPNYPGDKDHARVYKDANDPNFPGYPNFHQLLLEPCDFRIGTELVGPGRLLKLVMHRTGDDKLLGLNLRHVGLHCVREASLGRRVLVQLAQDVERGRQDLRVQLVRDEALPDWGARRRPMHERLHRRLPGGKKRRERPADAVATGRDLVCVDLKAQLTGKAELQRLFSELDQAIVILGIREPKRSRVRHQHRVSPAGEDLVEALVVVGLHVRAHHPDERGQRTVGIQRLKYGDPKGQAIRPLFDLDPSLPDSVGAGIRRWLGEVVLLPDGEQRVLDDKAAGKRDG